MKNLRGYIIGALVGVVLTISGQAFAGSISFVGKKITEENSVIVNGKELPVKAVNINGTSFTPNRALANELGLDIDFKNNTIYFSDKETAPMNAENGTATSSDTIRDQLKALEEQISAVYQERYPYSKKSAELTLEAINATPERKAEIEAELKEIDKISGPLSAKIAELEARRAELEAQQ